MSDAEADREHILMNYGSCALGAACMCIRGKHPAFDGVWGGLACESWQPLDAVSHEDLMRMAREQYASRMDLCGND
jgi:hypothetical protein